MTLSKHPWIYIVSTVKKQVRELSGPTDGRGALAPGFSNLSHEENIVPKTFAFCA